MIRSLSKKNQVDLVKEFVQPILYRNNPLLTIDENAKDNRPNPKSKFIELKEELGLKPMEYNKEDLEISHDTLRTVKTKIIAMPFDFSRDVYYKNKRSTRKKFQTKTAHLREFGANPTIFPESMFRDYYMQPIPLEKVQEGNK
ncbi:hypothetical protein DICPUDRAFT_77625 [Dictyostelium purpureum]|uniref:Uncharacterized protein n=1 Tax=Dictyostelium purpureum TaxID=5786 RepID=F0ZH65_DICPU|nr:uncharacterized protein DICPUDRAFT_77625 [Dictyostelium purpureum]EGC36741.1 hypothetical protein DICPUDRAFT_77625 [Dictyostelium purpureum]|eukprot:XP_003286766.1 hypothetical protein DICPUDRAFT_77625 [Dictyostelium purpureum]